LVEACGRVIAKTKLSENEFTQFSRGQTDRWPPEVVNLTPL